MAVTNFRATLRGTQFGKSVNTTLYLRTEASYFPDQTVTDAIGQEFEDKFGPLMTDDMAYNDIYYYSVTNGGPGTPGTPANFPMTGTITTDAMPPNVTCKITLISPPPDYPVIGYRHMSGQAEINISNGAWSTAHVNSMTAAAEFFGSVWIDGFGELWTGVLWSNTHREDGAITSETCSRTVGSQIRRKRVV